jgi:PadR family transcriptional regulator AphA
MDWALPEWTVLALLREQPRHGFAIAALTARDGAVGRIWQLPRPVVYRALGRLEAEKLVVATAVESGPGPKRTVYAATDHGRASVDEWLREPIRHVRDIRSHLLMKLALLDRRGLDPGELLRRQRSVLEPIVHALGAERDRLHGFDAVVLTWRYCTASAALEFVSQINDARPG